MAYKFDEGINGLLREKALIDLKEDEAIDYQLAACKKNLLMLAEQFDSKRAYKLAALMECADAAVDFDDDLGNFGSFEDDAKKNEEGD